jgi:hypothetical protein
MLLRRAQPPIADSDLPASIARDAEYLAADKAHIDATDPHLQYPTQERGDARYLRRDVTPPTYGSLVVGTSKNGYAGLYFPQAFGTPTLILNTGDWQSGLWSPIATLGWQWQYNRGNLSIFNPLPVTSPRGLYIGLYKGLGSLPGYPNDDFPVLKTDFAQLYLSVNNVYSAHITTAGTYVAVSDKNKKKNAGEVNYADFLKKIATIPIYKYSFSEESEEVERVGPFAQDFFRAFKLGGEIIDPLVDTPNRPDKLLAPADAIGVCLAGIKALIEEVEQLKLKK